jgi:hypothetical protein
VYKSNFAENADVIHPASIAEELWIDNIKDWPPVSFGDIYVHLIETKTVDNEVRIVSLLFNCC